MAEKKPDISREELRKKNRGQVLKLVATSECASRIELSRKMGITKTTVSKIVTEMMNAGFLVETAKQENEEIGRNPIGLDISPSAPKVAGLLIMRKYCEAVLCDMKLNILKIEKISQDWTQKEELIEAIYSLMDSILFREENVGGIGVAAIGPLDSRNGKIVNPPMFHGIHDVEIGRMLRERYGLPVFCDNDNQSAALAEKLFGNGKNYRDILLVGIANGVGCGIIVGDEKYQCSSGFTPEIGHMSIDYNGPLCVCGNRGCLETYLNTETTLRRMREATGKYYSYRTFCELSAELPEVDAILRDMMRKLSAGLVSAENILNSNLIIVGHEAVWWPDRYLDMLEEAVNQGKFNDKETRTKVKRAYNLDKTAVLGGVCNVLEQYFSGEMLP